MIILLCRTGPHCTEGTFKSLTPLNPWLVVNKEVWDVVPHVAVVVEVVHRWLQRRLQRVGVKFKQPQDDAPNQGGKQRERVVFGLGDQSFLHCKPGQSEQDPGQQVHVDLEEQEHSVTSQVTSVYVDAKPTVCNTWISVRSYLTINVVVISKH